MKIRIIAKPQSKQATLTELEKGKLIIQLKHSSVEDKKYQVKKKSDQN